MARKKQTRTTKKTKSIADQAVAKEVVGPDTGPDA
jgi:hypothetical protein